MRISVPGCRVRQLVVAAVTIAPAVALGAESAVAAIPKATSQVSLGGWKLTLPVDSSGCQCGEAAELNPAAVTPPWLVRNSDGSLTFWAPTKGARTRHSQHPRTELISLTDYQAGVGTHTLRATLSVQQLPSAQDIIVGQVHGGGTSSAIPLLMLHYQRGSIVVVTRNSPTVSGGPKQTVFTGIPLNAKFSYAITQRDANFLVSVNYGSKQEQVTVPVPESFAGMDVRFQAGDYQQSDANDSATDGGRLTITALSQS